MSEAYIAVKKKRVFVADVLWFALTTSLCVYLVAAYLVVQGKPQADFSGTLHMALAAVAVVLALVSVGIKTMAFSMKRLHAGMPDELSAEAMARIESNGGTDQPLFELATQMSPRERTVLSMSRKLLMPYIVHLALNEAIVLLGVAVAFMANSVEMMYPFFTGGLLLNVFSYRLISKSLDRAISDTGV